MIDLVLNLLHRWRPTRYRGIGIRGGFLLGILWAGVSGVGCRIGLDPLGMTLALVSSAVVGYRLERVGGAVAVAIFSLGLWVLPCSTGWPWSVAAGFGFLMGLVVGARTREQPKHAEQSAAADRGRHGR